MKDEVRHGIDSRREVVRTLLRVVQYALVVVGPVDTLISLEFRGVSDDGAAFLPKCYQTYSGVLVVLI